MGSTETALRGLSDFNPWLYSELDPWLDRMLSQALRRNTVGYGIRILLLAIKTQL